jgi:hypothetical protein
VKRSWSKASVSPEWATSYGASQPGEISWSEVVYRMFEVTPGTRVTFELIGSRVHPEDLPMMYDMVERAQRGENHFEYEHGLAMPGKSVKRLHLIAHGR